MVDHQTRNKKEERMKSILLTLFLILGLGQIANAHSVLKITDSGGGTVTIFDNLAGDSNGALGVVNFAGTVGLWTIVATVGLSDPFIGPSELDLFSIQLAGGGSSLTLEYSDHGFSAFTPGWRMEFGGTISNGGTVTYDAWQDNSNAVFGTASHIGTIGPLGPGAFSGTLDGFVIPLPDSEYSLYQRLIVTSPSSGTLYSGDAFLTPVPEPTSLFLLGSGLVGFAGFARRKLRKS
jgi:hypothetical protein